MSRRVDFGSIARNLFTVEQLPDGALPCYDKDPDALADIYWMEHPNGIYTTFKDPNTGVEVVTEYGEGLIGAIPLKSIPAIKRVVLAEEFPVLKTHLRGLVDSPKQAYEWVREFPEDRTDQRLFHLVSQDNYYALRWGNLFNEQVAGP